MKKMLDWLRSSPAIDPRSLHLPMVVGAGAWPLTVFSRPCQMAMVSSAFGDMAQVAPIVKCSRITPGARVFTPMPRAPSSFA